MVFGALLFQRSESNRWRTAQDSQRWTSSSVNLSSSTTRSSSCQCTTTLCGRNKETHKSVNVIPLQVRIVLADFRAVVRHSRDLDQKRNRTELPLINQWRLGLDCWTNDAQLCRKTSSYISCHLRPGKRRIKKHGKGKEVYPLQRKWKNIELIFRTIISANQPSVHGAVADLCKELYKDSKASGKSGAHEYLGTVDIPTEISTTDLYFDKEICCKTVSVNSNIYVTCRSHPKLKIVEKDNSSSHLMQKKDQMRRKIYVESAHCLEMKKHPEREGGFSEIRKSALSWIKFDWLSVSKWTSFMDSNRERNQQTFTTETRREAVFHYCPSTWKKMDRRQSWMISSRLHRGVNGAS